MGYFFLFVGVIGGIYLITGLGSSGEIILSGTPIKTGAYLFMWMIDIFTLVLSVSRIKDDKDIEDKIKAIEEQKTCPKCAETVKKEAKVCRFCQHEF